jgi:hypothetical protein
MDNPIGEASKASRILGIDSGMRGMGQDIGCRSARIKAPIEADSSDEEAKETADRAKGHLPAGVTVGVFGIGDDEV